MKGGEPRALLPLVVVTALLLTPAPAVARFTASTSATATFRAADSFGPRNLVPPSLGGAPMVGRPLTASRGVWEPAGTAVTITWQLEKAGVWTTVATGTTYTPGVSDVWRRLRVLATGAGVTVLSAPAQVTPPPRPVNLVPPAVTGEVRTGLTLTATVGDWANQPTLYSRQWLRCPTAATTSCSVVAGRTGATYTLSTADIGSYVHHRVTASNPGGSATVTSASVPVAPSFTTGGSISGRPFTPADVRVSAADWSLHAALPSTQRISFWRCPGPSDLGCVQVATGESATYSPVSADIGSWIRAREHRAQNGLEAEARSDGSIGPIQQLPPRLTAAVTTNVPSAPGTAPIADGDLSTAWNPSATERADQWVRLDFGSVKSLTAYDAVGDFWNAAFDVSLDGSSWTPIAADHGADMVAETVFSPAVQARFLRLRLTASTPHAWWLSDIRVWGE